MSSLARPSLDSRRRSKHSPDGATSRASPKSASANESSSEYDEATDSSTESPSKIIKQNAVIGEQSVPKQPTCLPQSRTLHHYETRSSSRQVSESSELRPAILKRRFSPAKRKPPQKREISEKWKIFQYILPAVTCIVVLIASIYAKFKLSSGNEKSHSNFAEFLENLKSFRILYPKMDIKVWSMIRASMRASFDTENPSRPAILTLIGSDHSMESLDYFALDLAKFVSKNFPPFTKYKSQNFSNFDCRRYANEDYVKVRQSFDDFFLQSFGNKLYRVALLNRIDLLPGNSPLVLNLHCDDSNAPYKKVFIILTLLCRMDIFEEFSTDRNLAIECLAGQWSKNLAMSRDKVGALVSRLGAYPYVTNSTV